MCVNEGGLYFVILNWWCYDICNWYRSYTARPQKGYFMKIQTSAENYLEAILLLSKKMSNVRAVDIAQYMGFSKPTISIAMKQFRENGYINIDSNRYITLTEKGAEIANRMHERHMLIAKLLMMVGVDEETAYIDACEIEHCISDKSFECLKAFYNQQTKG